MDDLQLDGVFRTGRVDDLRLDGVVGTGRVDNLRLDGVVGTGRVDDLRLDGVVGTGRVADVLGALEDPERQTGQEVSRSQQPRHRPQLPARLAW